MKKYSYFDGLLVIHPLISARYSTFTTSAKNITDYSPPLKQTKHTQAAVPAVQTAHNKKYKRNFAALLGLFCLWLMAGFYANEKSIRLPRWQLENIALLKIIRDTAASIWNHHRPDKKNQPGGLERIIKVTSILTNFGAYVPGGIVHGYY